MPQLICLALILLPRIAFCVTTVDDAGARQTHLNCPRLTVDSKIYCSRIRCRGTTLPALYQAASHIPGPLALESYNEWLLPGGISCVNGELD